MLLVTKGQKIQFSLQLSPLPLFTLTPLSSFSQFIAVLIIVQSKANSCIPRLYFLPEYLVQSEGLSLNFLLRGPDCFIHLHIMVMWYGSALLTTTKYRNTYIKPRKYPCLEICYPEEWFPQFTGRDIVATFLCLCISLCTSTACAHSIKIKIYSCKLLFCFSLFLFFCRYPL